jgi:hypothetical protein
MKRHKGKKEDLLQLDIKYGSQVAQLEADGVNIKKRQLLFKLLEQANGDVEVVKQLLAKKEAKSKKAAASANTTEEGAKKRPAVDVDDLENLRQLRSAGVHGNPIKILAVFHECDNSIEKTIARLEKDREEREQRSEHRVQVKNLPRKSFIHSFIKIFFTLATCFTRRNS